MHHSQQTASQHARQQHHRHRQQQTPSTHSLVPQQISTPPTTPTASATFGDEDITLSDASLAADRSQQLDSNTTGTVNADTVNTLSGAAADSTAYDSDGISNSVMKTSPS